MRRAARALLRAAASVVLGAVLVPAPAYALRVSVAVGSVESPSFSARDVRASWQGLQPKALDVAAAEVSALGRRWRNVSLHCGGFSLGPGRIDCAPGTLDFVSRSQITLHYLRASRELTAALVPAAGERWLVRSDFDTGRVNVEVDNGSITRLQKWLQVELVPGLSAGSASGTVTVSERGAKLDARLQLSNAAFSDPAGLHAGDKLGGALMVSATRSGRGWNWQADADWRRGEVFWQPVYLGEEPRRMRASGSFDESRVVVEQARFEAAGYPDTRFAGTWDRAKGRWEAIDLAGKSVDMAALCRQVLSPYFESSTIGKLECSGGADLRWQVAGGRVVAIDLALREARIRDERGRFELRRVNAAVPWRLNAATNGTLRIGSGELLKVPLGETSFPVRMHGLSFFVRDAGIPLLDGRLNLRDFSAAREQGEWRWQFEAAMTPVSLERLTEAFDLPRMHGSFSGEIPRVSYRDSTMRVDGQLVFNVFDGRVIARRLQIVEPFGLAPRLIGDVDANFLDLGLLTRAFSFGTIEGRIDARVHDIELVNWRPVRFDARVYSSAGRYPKKISQRAIQNISSLGGAGAVQALQRSFLQFFEQFGYDRIEISCVLRGNVCRMGGIAPTADGGFLLVRGGGIPAITVIGYNREVSWPELVERLQRITQENVKPVIR